MIAVIGLGFVGLATALSWASRSDREVRAYEANPARRELYRSGRLPFHEPELQERLLRYGGDKLRLCETAEEAVKDATIVFVCVGTPEGADGSADLSDLIGAVGECADAMLSSGGRANSDNGEFIESKAATSPRVIVVRSTVPPGTTEKVLVPLLEARGLRIGEGIGMAYNPEFLREGLAWEDASRPDRIVVGEVDSAGGSRLARIYAEHFDAPVHRVSATTGEFVKLMSNSLLATLISFSNEMAMTAERTGGIDVRRAFRLLHEDRRWQAGEGKNAGMAAYVYPGCGFGGYCLPKDTAAFIRYAESAGGSAPLLREVAAVNERAKRATAERVAAIASREEKIGILGLSFKPNSDDVRGTASADIIRHLLELGFARIVAYDPLAMGAFRQGYGLPIGYANTLGELAAEADLLVLLTDWKEFRDNRHLFDGKKLVDGRYALERNGGMPNGAGREDRGAAGQSAEAGRSLSARFGTG